MGTGDKSTTLFYLDKSYIISNSYTLHHGASEAGATAMTDVTDYTLDKDNGTLTITTAGLTTVGTGNIYAEYSFNDVQYTDTQLQEALDRAQRDIDKKTHNHFAVGTHDTPDYTQVTNEKHTGKGKYDKEYYLDRTPIPDVSTEVASANYVGATAIYVESTNGFPSSGYISIEDYKLPYGSKSSTAFWGITNQASASHATATPVYPYVIEISTTSSGTTPAWTVLERDEDYDLDFKSGRVNLYRTDYDSTHYSLEYPQRLTPNRFRGTYNWGTNTIPDDIKRCCLMIASRDLLHTTGRRNLLHGQETNTEDFNLDNEWIKDILDSYKNRKHSNI